MPLDWASDGRDWPYRDLSRFVRTRGVHWHVQRGGTGPKVLLLHGAGAATHSWRGLYPHLLDRFEVLAPDLPGQGFSSGVSPRFALPTMAEDLGALLAAEAFAPNVIVGHSAGAAIALRLVLQGGADPRAIVCLNGALTPFRGVAGVLFPPLAKFLSLNPFTASLFARTAGAPGAVRSLILGTGSAIDPEGLRLYERLITTPDHVAATLGMMARWNLEPLIADLPRVRPAVTLALGLRDRAVPPADTRALAPRLPRASVVEFPDLGHLMHEEAPERIAPLIVAAASETEAAEDLR